MKISGIDKDFEEIIYYLDNNGFKPFASCDGVEANHINPNDVNNAYIAFLKSPRIIELMAEFLKDKENFNIILTSEEHFKPHEQYGNTISGTTYDVHFSNKTGENTHYFESIIRSLVEKRVKVPSDEEINLDMLEKVLEENSNSDLTFQVSFNIEYQPHMRKQGRINKLTIATKSGDGRIDGNIMFQTQRDMGALASILSKKYNMHKIEDNSGEYPETEFIMPRFDRCSCSVYFIDEHLTQILEQIQYIRQIAHTLPTFESREWIGSDEELFDEYFDEYDENIDDELVEQDYIYEDFDKTPLSSREIKLAQLENEAKRLSEEERKIPELSQIIDGRI